MMSATDPRIIPCLDPTPTEEDKALAHSLLNESDRGCAIVGADLLDARLESLFRAFCRAEKGDVRRFVDPLFVGYGPLASFSAKIRLAYALYLIPPATHRDLELIRSLRNEFAHHWGPISFDDARISGRLEALLGHLDPDDGSIPAETLTSQATARRAKFAARVTTVRAHLSVIEQLINWGIDVRTLIQNHGSDFPAGFHPLPIDPAPREESEGESGAGASDLSQ